MFSTLFTRSFVSKIVAVALLANLLGSTGVTIETASADAVTEAQAEADALQDLADGFQSDADAAQEVADDLQSVADAAQATADSAQAQADSLQSSGASVEDVTGAQAVADDLQLVADAAQATADSAQAQADSLQSTADAAQDLADAAQAEVSRLENLPDLEVTLVRFTSDTDGDGTTEIISTISDPESIVVSEYNIPYQLSNTGTGDVASTDGAAAANVNVYGDADTDNFLGTYNEDFFGTIPTVFLTAGSSDFFFPLALTNDALLSIQDFEFLTFCVDEDELVEEADETNNCLTTVNLLYVEPDAVPVLTIEAGSDQTVTLGDTVTLSGLVSNNVIDSSISSEIVIDWGDSSSDETISATLSGVDNVFTSSGHTYSSIGLYPVIVIVTGGDTTVTDTLTVTVEPVVLSQAEIDAAAAAVATAEAAQAEIDAAAAAAFVLTIEAGSDQTITLGGTVTLSGLISNVSASSTLSDVTIDWEDGSSDTVTATASGADYNFFTSHVYSVEGDYLVTVSTTDGSVSATDTLTVTVEPVVLSQAEIDAAAAVAAMEALQAEADALAAALVLTIEAGSDQTITLGDTVTLSGLGSNAASSQVTAIIDWGDSSSDETIAATLSGTDYSFTSSEHTYSSIGLYPVIVTVTDGVTTATDIFTVMVNEVPAASTPTATAAADMDITDISMDPLTGMISYTAANLGNLDVDYTIDAGSNTVYLNYGEADETAYAYQWQTETGVSWVGTFFNAGGSEIIDSGVGLISGEHSVMVCIEGASVHGEISSGFDNCEIETFQVGSDLTVTDIRFEESATVPGEFTVYGDLANVGDIDVDVFSAGTITSTLNGGSEKIYIWTDLAAGIQAFLDANGTSDGTFEPLGMVVNLVDGDIIQVCVDSSDFVTELDESNNCLSETYEEPLAIEAGANRSIELGSSFILQSLSDQATISNFSGISALTATVDWGDSSTVTTGQLDLSTDETGVYVQANHTYLVTGTYTVNICATDSGIARTVCDAFSLSVVPAVVTTVSTSSTSGGGGGGGGSSSGRGGSSGGGGGSIYAQNEEDDDEDEVELAEEACAEAMSFTDVSEGDDMYEYIYDLWCREVVEGKDLYTYAPEDDVTRAEFLKIALLNAGYSEDSTGSESFSDVSAEDWFYNYVLVGVEMGIIEGYEDGSFRPNSSINRAEALIILMRVAGMDDTDASGLSSSFSDVDSDDWYASAVFVATANGVVEGYPDGTFMPGDAISRAEVAAMAVRSL